MSNDLRVAAQAVVDHAHRAHVQGYSWIELDLEWFEALRAALSGPEPPTEAPESSAEKALRNVMLMAMRERRKNPEMWGPILRFCKEAGMEPNILRESEPEPATDAGRELAETKTNERIYDVDRFHDGRLKAEGARVTARSEEEALKKAKSLFWEEQYIYDIFKVKKVSEFLVSKPGGSE